MRGGKRTGAGRKTISKKGRKLQQQNIRISNDEKVRVNKAAELANEKPAALIRKILLKGIAEILDDTEELNMNFKMRWVMHSPGLYDDELDCAVQVSRNKISVTYIEDHKLLTYKGEKINSVSFDLSCKETKGEASLFWDNKRRNFTGWWSESVRSKMEEGFWSLAPVDFDKCRPMLQKAGLIDPIQ